MMIRFSAFQPQGIAAAPVSKSVAHRMLILAAFADGESRLRIGELSEDLASTVCCLRALGVKITQNGDVFSVVPVKEIAKTATLDCGESASTLRFLLPVAAVLGVCASFTGQGCLPQRPLQDLIDVLHSGGVTVSNGFPVEISGTLKAGDYTLSGNISSQFASGLLLALSCADGESTVRLMPPVVSAPYLQLTLDALRRFGVSAFQSENTYTVFGGPKKPGDFDLEGDWSNGAALLCLGAAVRGLNPSSLQGDRRVLEVLERMGARILKLDDVLQADLSALHGVIVDSTDIPDLVPVLAAAASFAAGETCFIGAARLRTKESDRISSVCKMIQALGGEAVPTQDGLRVIGTPRLRGGTVDSCGDHRIVMAAAVLAQRCERPVTVTNAQAINKSYPSYFDTIRSLGGEAYVL